MEMTQTLPALVLDVPEIANQSPKHVAQLLGGPSNAGPEGYVTKNVYRHGTVEIVFRRERAAHIVVRGAKELPFDAGALRKLGLPHAKPSRKTQDGALYWNRLSGIADVTLHPGTDDPVSHVSISVVPPGQASAEPPRRWSTTAHH